MERLQKVLAHANVASRRKSEKLILEKRVKVNGKVITELGFKVNRNDQITVDNKPIQMAKPVYFLLNKPTGYISSVKDEKGRKTVMDLIEEEDKHIRLYPVGRLDYDTAGLLLLTNDGELTNQLTHPKFHIEKEYLVRVDAILIRKKIIELRKGVTIDQGYFAKPKEVRLIELNKDHQSTLLSITLTEGKNKQVRKMIEALGYKVKKLTRVRYDFLTLEGVKRGSYRPLKVHEIKKLYGHSILK